MSVKTISRLGETENINNDDLFYLSKHIEQYKYTSVNVKYGTLLCSLTSNIQPTMENMYGLYENVIPDLSGNISELSDDVVNIEDDINNIRNSIEGLSSITPEWDIKNTTTYIAPSKSIKVNGDDFMVFNFEDGKKNTESCKVKHSGNMLCYGWITAPQTMDPADAWVGIEVASSQNSHEWKLLALQPWIIGSKSSVMQYVGFNCPVQAGTYIRITTGFQIKDFGQSFAGRGMVFNIKSDAKTSNINNSFIGYILGV